MDKYVCTLPKETQKQIYIALAKTGMSFDDVVRGMNSRLCDLADTIDLSKIAL